MQIGRAVVSAELELKRREGVAILGLKEHEESSLLAELMRGWSCFLLGRIACYHSLVPDIERWQILR